MSNISATLRDEIRACKGLFQSTKNGRFAGARGSLGPRGFLWGVLRGLWGWTAECQETLVRLWIHFSGGSNRDVTIQDATETLADKKTPIVMCTMHLKQHIMNQFLCRLHSLQLTNFSIKKYWVIFFRTCLMFTVFNMWLKCRLSSLFQWVLQKSLDKFWTNNLFTTWMKKLCRQGVPDV